MSKEYFNIGIYDNLFFDKIIERGIEIYLSDKITDLNQEDNIFDCKIEGSDIYEVSVSFKNSSDEVDTMACTCPFAKEGSNCKHMYALLLKIKCNYELNKIKKTIRKELKNLKNHIKVNDTEYIIYKYRKENRLEIELFNNYIKSLKNRVKIIENKTKSKIKIVDSIIILKDIIKEQNDIINKLEELFLNDTYDEDYKDYETIVEENKSPGLFGTFINLLENVNKEHEKRDKEYEEAKQRYRRAIIEQNLYEGKTNEDIYDGLE